MVFIGQRWDDSHSDISLEPLSHISLQVLVAGASHGSKDGEQPRGITSRAANWTWSPVSIRPLDFAGNGGDRVARVCSNRKIVERQCKVHNVNKFLRQSNSPPSNKHHTNPRPDSSYSQTRQFDCQLFRAPTALVPVHRRLSHIVQRGSRRRRCQLLEGLCPASLVTQLARRPITLHRLLFAPPGYLLSSRPLCQLAEAPRIGPP